jgi:uncharacterized protein with NRDE domain
MVVANRDEFYNRRTAAAAYWEDHPEILGGRDLEAGGTWLGMSRSGRISMITNYRDPKHIDPKAPSRGYLVSDYLSGTTSPGEYLHALEPNGKKYNGFNLITGTTEELWYFSNYREGVDKLNPGLYGLSNHLIETPWPKVVKGKKMMREVTAGQFSANDLFEVLYNDELADDTSLPDTGVGLERERSLSSMFIKSPGYGTRCSTVILVNYDDEVFFAERVYDLSTFSFSEKSFTFSIAKT